MPGLHFNEAYAPVMHWESFQTILAIGAIFKMDIHQFDVKSTYLHVKIEEEVWVKQPEGLRCQEKKI